MAVLGLWNLRSFVPREIRKFIKCVPAEVLKSGRSVCPSSLFMKPLRMTGKETGTAESGRAPTVSVQTHWAGESRSLCGCASRALPSHLPCALHYECVRKGTHSSAAGVARLARSHLHGTLPVPRRDTGAPRMM